MRNPIGIFDSGVGGTSIWKELNSLLPNENTIYLADSKNAPYGSKDEKQILDLCTKNTELLLQQGCKLIVVACNTATTNAITYLRESYTIPFIGIEPAIKPAALSTRTKKIGVLATRGTLASNLFHDTSKLYTAGIKVYEQEGSGLVELIEKGRHNSSEIREILEALLDPMLAMGIDGLVLGCTHYPYLIPVLEEILPQHVKIIDSGSAVAQQTKAILEQYGLLNTDLALHPQYTFYSNTNTTVLKQFVSLDDAFIAYLDF